jgi:uncharacterized protein (TIGR02145 family)
MLISYIFRVFCAFERLLLTFPKHDFRGLLNPSGWFRRLSLLVLSAIAVHAFPEGTKQLRPMLVNAGQLYYQWTSWYSANPLVTDEYRIHIHIKNPGEKIYFGLNWYMPQNAMGFRILDPSGTLAQNYIINKVNGSPGFIDNYSQAIAGPNIINPAGYNALSFTPATSGDYMFDIDSWYTAGLFDFDVTVIDTTISPLAAIDGRVWCKQWSVHAADGCQAILYDLTEDSIVSAIDFNGLANEMLNITFSRNGIYPPPLDWLISRKSMALPSTNRSGGGYLDHKIFLNDPDSTVYPTGILGVIDPASFTVTPNCDGTVGIYFNANKSGWVELDIQIDPDPGIQPVDVIISDSANAGINHITWNGVNGLGQAVANGTLFYIRAVFLNGLTNLVVNRVGNNPGGFVVQLHRPSGPTPPLFWDDRAIAPANYNLTGCVSVPPSTGCHNWFVPPYSEDNAINTWWYASSSSASCPNTPFKRNFHAVTDTTVCTGDTVFFHGQSFFSAGTFYVNSPSILTGCDSSYMLNLTLLPHPVINLGSDTTICTGQNITFDAGFCSGCTYQWGNLATGQMNIGTLQTYTATQPGKYTATVTGSNGCKGRDTVKLAISLPLVVSVSIAASANPACAGAVVTLTALPVNPGSSPVYEWKVNSVSAGVNSTVFSYVPVNGDVVTCQLTSSIASCISNSQATSNSIAMTVTPLLPVSVAVSPSQNQVCAGTPVTFLATPTNGGTNPSFQWKVNSFTVGVNNSAYSYIPVPGDLVSCILTSSETCTSGNPAVSNPVTVVVNQNLPVSVSISASSNPFCIGQPVTFTATPNNGGITPGYQWMVNGVNTGSIGQVYTYIPVSGDKVACILTSTAVCVTQNPATSNEIILTGFPGLPAGVSITANPIPFCPGTPVTFIAVPVNGGTNPGYQWQINASNVNNGNTTAFTYNPVSGDLVTCILTSNLTCVSNNPATSNMIRMLPSPVPLVTFSLCSDTITTVNAQPFRLRGGLPLGGTYTGPGVNSTTGIFSPPLAGSGMKTITYSYTNIAACLVSATARIYILPVPNFNCGSLLTDIRDNKTYPTVQLGSHCWMQTNLDFGSEISDLIPQTDNCVAEKYVHTSKFPGQNGLPQSGSIFYQWDELMRYQTTPGSQGLCPPGWHVPAPAEWNDLIAFYNGPGQAAGPMKDTLPAGGFNSYQQGFLYGNNTWAFVTDPYAGSMYWTSVISGTERAIAKGLNEYNPSVSSYTSLRSNAFGVRCVKDNSEK